ncbi:polyprenyl synthetase family protein [Solwaraspora sp. WMMA2101]|uniref:polyprenyl synthetase family protein n=1 Tax=Solwaraspora sp. WMMA2101 TaxID=3404124 RepID=UPI003B93116B
MTAAATTPRDVRARLATARSLLEPPLRHAVRRLATPVRTVAEYHFGWCDAAGDPTDAGWGKGLRGGLTLAAADAVGGSAASAVPAAVAVELVHNFTLLHDDVMDHDQVRRGRPTAGAAFGDAQAILAGDALLALALDTVRGRPAATAEVCRALLDLVSGQSADVAFESRTTVGLDACLTMAAGKTAALIAAACALGALSADADADADRVDGLRGYGHHLGMAFQLTDDLLGIWGDPAVTGKPVDADLRRRKKSLPVVYALTSGTAAGAELASLYAIPGASTDTQVRRATQLVEQAGGRDWARQEADRHRLDALACLAAARPGRDGAAVLAGFADLATTRDH